MNYDQLQPNLIISQLEERLLELKEALKKLNDTNSRQTSNNYSLRIAQKNGYPDYYYINKDTPPQGIYIPKKKHAFAKQLAQKDYNSKVITLLQKEITATERYLKETADRQTKARTISKIQALYYKMCTARQEFFWEHFGLMDSAEYVKNTVSKLNLYIQNKIIPGKNLIITMEIP